jgi:TPR repeat protein
MGSIVFDIKNFSQSGVFSEYQQGGNMPIQFKLFSVLAMLTFGILGCGTSIDFSELKKRAEGGDVIAQSSLAYAYKTGSGVEKNPEEAIKWIQRAADNGSAEAQHNLGLSYVQGYGVPQNYEKAREWFLKSAGQGFLRAYGKIGTLHQRGLGVPVDPAKAAQWFEKGAQNGVQGDQYNLGIMYTLGEGVEKDNVKAYQWLTAARVNGENKKLTWMARAALSDLIPKMSDDEKIRAKVINETLGY